MTQKNETLTLVVSFVLTLGILGGGLWWLLKDRQPISTTENNTPSNPSGNNTSTTENNTSSNPSGNNTSTTENNTTPTSELKANFASVNGIPSGLFNYGGSTTWAPIRESVDPIIQQTYPEFRLRYTDPISGTPGSASGIEMLLEGQLAFSQSSRSLNEDEYQAAQNRGYSLKQIPVALDGIAIAVNHDLNLSGLTVQQVRGIYTGQIRNWQEVGGPNLPIIPYSREIEDGGTVEFFLNNVVGEQEFGSNVQYVYSTTPALRKVSENRGAIYYASAPEVVPQCTIKTLPIGRQAREFIPPYQEPPVTEAACREQGKRDQLNLIAFQNGQYPITRRLFVIVKEDGGNDQKAGESYAQLLLTKQGQDLIENTGFVRIR